mgnify:CR=1 FL=1
MNYQAELTFLKNILEKIEPTNKIINVLELESNLDLVSEEKFSKTNNSLITKEDKEKLEFGEYLHYLFEIVDFKNPDFSMIDSFFYKNLHFII